MKKSNLSVLVALFVSTHSTFCSSKSVPSYYDSEYLGELHNNILDGFSEANFPGLCKVDGKKCETDVDIVVKEVNSYITTKFPIITTKFLSDVIPKALENIKDSESFQDLGKMLSKKLSNMEKISKKDATYMKKNLRNLDKLSQIAKRSEIEKQREKLNILLKKAEKVDASELAKGAVIMGITVYMHSFEYWISVELDEKNPWYQINEERKANQGEIHGRRMHWFIRDGMGAVSGFITGFLIGGPIGGGIGAAGGGAAASLIKSR
mmetsp:Transcript_34842/g.68591  ORF Transcript_34842/g.68591 Transcript_34842/m.68591 type:complete len:265 (+) Transcript_34842:68-862(+)|eukprot:CAMPEP_0194305286 /NCGR_PEP_ID=MMETSP0171-20130528/2759_1 /TAXON_ID=218684 /ORGANISM="Corethron pennatum, Strain L29A3" /LENGTH=264 /DNA_ID=CAMNT_0039056769 /DNA_START=66 /DNA_END=857 /DNA_ORIENTATION=+